MQGLYTYYFFIGIGGIGMSALARYFVRKGAQVFGYDKTPTKLTKTLELENITIVYSDSVEAIPEQIKNNMLTSLIVYTPAIPETHVGLQFLKTNGFVCEKRAKVLGRICNNAYGIAIAGTHGKTSITTCTTYIMHHSHLGCTGFLGGISKNFKTNFIYSPTSNYVVVEADEYDRSFHNLYPHTALVSSMDSDHLDIYSTHAEVIISFYEFVSHIKESGIFIHKYGLDFTSLYRLLSEKNIQVYTYHVTDSKADFYAERISIINQGYELDVVTPWETIKNIQIFTPGKITIENAIAAIAISRANGVTPEEIIAALSTFRGVERRLDVHVANQTCVYIDDYAHHPEELRAAISSIKELYEGKKVLGVFQPHLFSRTQDFAAEFAQSLSLLDEVVLLDIYPAREKPIEGITSHIILKDIAIPHKSICSKQELVNVLAKKQFDVLVTMGAGDIDTLIEPLTKMCEER